MTTRPTTPKGKLHKIKHLLYVSTISLIIFLVGMKYFFLGNNHVDLGTQN